MCNGARTWWALKSRWIVIYEHSDRITNMESKGQKPHGKQGLKSLALLREILAVFPPGDKIKIWIVVGAQIFLSFLDLAGIAVIGVLGALAVTGVESGTPGNRVSAVLRLLHLSNYSFQAQVTILGLTAAALLIVRTFSSIFLTKRTLLFMSRRAALISSELVTNLFSRSILDLQKYLIYLIDYQDRVNYYQISLTSHHY